MKILIFAPYFPPYNAIGSVRTGNFVRFLISQNVDVRVISAHHSEIDQTQTPAVESFKVTFLNWSDANVQNQLNRKLKVNIDKSVQVNPNFFAFLRTSLRSILYWPDRHQFWVKPACKRADEIITCWRPDLIFASALPASSLLAAERTSKKHNIPWVAEFRDLWAGNEFNQTWIIKELIERIWEKKIISTSSMIITVSKSLADVLKARHGRNVEVVLNGFWQKNVIEKQIKKNRPLVIRHTGSLYNGKRDPSPLLSAISKLGKDRNTVRVEFYGPEEQLVNRLAKKFGVEDVVKGHPKVSYPDCMKLQADADVLLLIMWGDEREKDIYTGKFFEYVATENMILLMGNSESSLGKELERNEIGITVSNERDILRFLKNSIGVSKKGESLKSTKPSNNEKFSSSHQFSSIYPRLKKVSLE